MLQKIPAIILALSGLLITLVSAFFSIHGFIMFIPDKTLFLGILGLGIAFELAKITTSTFLFHRMKDATFPVMFKIYLSLAVLSLIVFSAIFTFVHLNAAVSSNMVESTINQTNIQTLVKRNVDIQASINQMNKQVADLPQDYVKARIKLMNEFTPVKERLEKEYSDNNVKLSQLQISTVKEDKFIFLTNLSEFTGIPREKIFSYVILFIVITIDPLAISLFLAASHILSDLKGKDSIVRLQVKHPFSTEKIEEIRQDAQEERKEREVIEELIEDELVDAERLLRRKIISKEHIRQMSNKE